MSEVQAKQVWDFVRRWDGQVGAVVVHCEQGMSRSPAVAAALCSVFGYDHDRFFKTHQPNRFVFDMMMKNCDPTEGSEASATARKAHG